MPYLVTKDVTVNNGEGESHSHRAGDVLADFEVSPFVRGKIAEGEAHYRANFEILNEDEAREHRVRITVAEGNRYDDGRVLEPPYDDYVGLHPGEILERMSKSRSIAELERVRAFEKAGLGRRSILEFTPAMERPPLAGYDAMSVREITAKMGKLGPSGIADVIAYEMVHARRPAIIEYEADEAPAKGKPDPVAATA